VSIITGFSDYERFLGKWDKILKSGMGYNILENAYFNEFAHMMLPKEDPEREAVKRFEKAARELATMDKKSILLKDHLF
jgi:hypothetical protein